MCVGAPPSNFTFYTFIKFSFHFKVCVCVLKFAPGLMQFEFTALLLTTEKLEMLMKATVFFPFFLSLSFPLLKLLSCYLFF